MRTSQGATKRFWYSVPTVMPSSATSASARLAARHLAVPELAPDDQHQPGEAEQQAEPLARRRRGDGPARRAARQPERGQHRLQADQQRDRAGADAGLHRRPDAAEVARLHQHAGDREVHPLRAAARPGARAASAIQTTKQSADSA